MTYHWYDMAGMAGVALIVVAYLLLQLGKLQATDLSYSTLNALGAALVLLSLLFVFNLAAFVMESFWLLISLYGLASQLVRRGAAH